MIDVQLPDGRTISVDATDPQQAALAARKFLAKEQSEQQPEASGFVDVARGAGRGLQKGVAGVVGLPGSFINAVDAAGKQTRAQDPSALDNLAETSLIGGLEPAGKSRFPAFASLDDLISQVPKPFGTGDVLSGIEAVTGSIPEPQTRAGQFTERGVEFGTGAAALPFGPGVTVVRAGIAGAAAGLGSEGLGQAFKGTRLEGIARLVGALGGGVGGATAISRVPTAGRALVREATEGLTPRDFTQAKALQRASQSEGVPLLGPEAIDSPPLQQLASNVAATPRGGAILDEATRQRPGQVAQAVERQAAAIGPEVTAREAGRAVRDAAGDVVQSATRARTAATSDFFEAAKGVDLPAPEIQRVITRIDKTPASRGGPVEAELSKLRTRLTRADGGPETNGGIIESVTKEFRDRTQLPKSSPDAITKETAAKIKPILKALNKTLEKHVEPIKEGRRLFQQITNEVITPLNESAVGAISQNKDVIAALNTAIRAVTDPKTVRPQDVRQTFRLLGLVDRDVPGKLTRIHLENAFSKAAKDLQSGPPRAVGANFRKAIMGEPRQRANIQTMFKELESLHGLSKGKLSLAFQNTMRILDRTGRIPGIGSPTASRAEFNRRTARGGVVSGAAGAADVTRSSLIGQIREFTENLNQRRNVAALARLFTARDGVDQIEMLAGGVKSNEQLRALVTALSAARVIQDGSGRRQ